MSRREEVDQALSVIDWKYDDYEGNWYAVLPLARTLADEIDALREENERLDRKRLENALAARRYLGKLHEERAAYAVLLESHEIILDALTESDDKLKAVIDRDERFDCLAAENADLRRELDELSREIVAAHFANATLDALRDVVREYDDEWQDWEPGDLRRLIIAAHAILYPKETDHVLGE
jgi:hypothetical protein